MEMQEQYVKVYSQDEYGFYKITDMEDNVLGYIMDFQLVEYDFN